MIWAIRVASFVMSQKNLNLNLKRFGNQHFSVATSYYNISTVCANKGDYEQGLEFGKKLYRTVENTQSHATRNCQFTQQYWQSTQLQR